MRHRLNDPTFSRFDTIPACDRQTDTHTQTHTRRQLIPAQQSCAGNKMMNSLLWYQYHAYISPHEDH